MEPHQCSTRRMLIMRVSNFLALDDTSSWYIVRKDSLEVRRSFFYHVKDIQWASPLVFASLVDASVMLFQLWGGLNKYPSPSARAVLYCHTTRPVCCSWGSWKICREIMSKLYGHLQRYVGEGFLMMCNFHLWLQNQGWKSHRVNPA